ncbi:MAG: hypothetical protein GZ091_14110 [Paludibacter sp.]|nr:hypothetical protein [Paludibacter sp.]
MGLLNSILKILADTSGNKYHVYEGSQKGKKTSYFKRGPKSMGAKGKTLSWFKW